jgi:hypothetical protein
VLGLRRGSSFYARSLHFIVHIWHRTRLACGPSGRSTLRPKVSLLSVFWGFKVRLYARATELERRESRRGQSPHVPSLHMHAHALRFFFEVWLMQVSTRRRQRFNCAKFSNVTLTSSVSTQCFNVEFIPKLAAGNKQHVPLQSDKEIAHKICVHRIEQKLPRFVCF